MACLGIVVWAPYFWGARKSTIRGLLRHHEEKPLIGYVTLGTNDLPRAAAFYDALLAEIGAKRLWDSEGGIAWGMSMDKPSLGILKPYDGKPATVGNGVMAAIVVDSKEKVDRVLTARPSPWAPRTKAPTARAARTSTRAISATWTATSSTCSTWEADPAHAEF